MEKQSTTNLEIATNAVPVEITTKYERWAWIIYDFANSAFEYVAMDSIFLLFLNYLAIQGGSRYNNPQNTVELPDFSSMAKDWFVAGSCNGSPTNCVIPWMNGYIRPGSFALNILSLSAIFNVFFLFSLNAVVDNSKYRKSLFLFCALMASFSTCLTVLPDAGNVNAYKISAFYVILATLFLGVSNAIHNSYLPLLADADPNLIALRNQERKAPTINGDRLINKAYEMATTSLSSYGATFSYASGLLGSALAALIVKYNEPPTSYKAALLLVGLWWMIFTIPAIIYFKARPGISLPPKTNHVVYSWKAMFKTIGSASKIPITFTFLIAYFFFRDGINTISNTGILLSQNELKYSSSIQSIALIISPLASFCGSILFYFIEKKFAMRPQSILVFLMSGYVLLAGYGVLGLTNLPIGLRASNTWIMENCVSEAVGDQISLTSGSTCIHIPYEFYTFIFIGGMLVGGLKGVTRTIFSQIVPKGQAYIFFGLYEISGKGSAFLGRLITSSLYDQFGSMRYAFVYLVIIFIITTLILRRLDLEKGKNDAEYYSKMVDEKIEIKTLMEMGDKDLILNAPGQRLITMNHNREDN